MASHCQRHSIEHKFAVQHEQNNLDAIRLLAATAVIFSHAGPLTGGLEPTIAGTSVGSIAVKIFFVISGYLVYISWRADPSAHRYLTRRSLRIFPALVALCVVTILVVGPIFTHIEFGAYFSDGATYDYFKNAVLYPVYHLPGVFQTNVYRGAVNGSLWSLPVEFAMYLMLPAVWMLAKYLRGDRWVLLLFTIGLCVVSLILVRIAPIAGDIVVYGTLVTAGLDVAPYFFLGATFRHMNLERCLDPVMAVVLIFCAMVFQTPSSAVNEAALYFLIPYTVLTVAFTPHRWLCRVGAYGDVSYGVYIYGFLVQQCVADLSDNRLSAAENALVSVPLVLCLAFLSWHLIEKKALMIKPSRPASQPFIRNQAVNVIKR